MNVIELKGVSYVYSKGTPFQKTALDNVNVSFEKGKITGLIGHTGSGKSTLVNLLNGLNKPTEGQVFLDGADIWEKPKEIGKIRYRVGLVMQYPEYQLFDETVRLDIGFAPRNQGLSDEEIEARVAEAARFTGIGEDLLEKYLPALPAELLPFSEACRLLLNRGMGLLFAGEKIAGSSADTDFILRNLYKAILGTGDAILISQGMYRWKITERLKKIQHSSLPDAWKTLYHEAVDFKCAPHRELKPDMVQFWHTVRDFYRAGMLYCAGTENNSSLPGCLAEKSKRYGEKNLFNYLKYCIKSRSFTLNDFGKHSLPAVTWILPELYDELEKLPAPDSLKQNKLYQHWLIFN